MPRFKEKFSGGGQALEDAKSGKMPDPLAIPPTHTTCKKCNRLLMTQDVDAAGLGPECRGEPG